MPKNKPRKDYTYTMTVIQTPEPGYRRYCRPSAPFVRTVKSPGDLELVSGNQEIIRHG